MNVFLKALLGGKLTRTPKLEAAMRALPDQVKRYHEIEQSSQFAEYQRLKALVESDAFATNQSKAARLEQLGKTRSVKQYLQLKEDLELQAFLQWAKDDVEYAKLAEDEIVKNDPHLQAMLKVERSSKLLTWQGLEKAPEVIEYLKLKAEVVDYSQEIKREKELAKSEDIVFHDGMSEYQVKRFDNTKLIFNEEFTLTQIQKSGWVGGFAYPEGLKPVHSYTNEVQSYNNGRNVEIREGILHLMTKKEKNEGPAWDEKKGMVMKQFAYSSDVIYNVQPFEEGTVLKVKCRCRGLNLNHGIYLRSDKHVPFISVFNYTDRAVYCGLKANLKENDYKHEITGLQPIPFSIYTLVWGKDEIVWYLNDMEVHRTKNIIPKGEKMYLHLYSFQFEGHAASEGTLEIDWIKAYKF